MKLTTDCATEITAMTPEIKVIFSCGPCSTTYQAIQARHKGRGSFKCACGSVVHAWDGDYDFSDWLPLTNIEKSDGQRLLN